jgi:SAM-dependent methyltransferase
MIYQKNQGYCHCCRQDTNFLSLDPWFRDHYQCTKCASIPRQRHIQYILDTYFPKWSQSQIHESSPSNAYLFNQAKTSYSFSHYIPNTPLGTTQDGVRSENLESLTFQSNTFDIFITQDVFEHIFDPSKAAKEIMRVLKPGGVHVFTAPKHNNLYMSECRASLQGDTISYLKEPMYHGNPIGDGRSLVTWDYGQDFENLLFEWTQCPTTTYVTRDDSLGLKGEHLEVFVMKKQN